MAKITQTTENGVSKETTTILQYSSYSVTRQHFDTLKIMKKRTYGEVKIDSPTSFSVMDNGTKITFSLVR